MRMLFELLSAAMIFAAVFSLIFAAKKWIYTPVPLSEGEEITAVIRVSGGADGLEQTVKGLLFLRRNGIVYMDIVIEDHGMDEKTRKTARLLARENGEISLRNI